MKAERGRGLQDVAASLRQSNYRWRCGFALVLRKMHIGCHAYACSLRSLAPRMRVMRRRGVIVSGFWLARIAASLGAMAVERPPIPTEERKPAWRRACLAYREIRDAGGSDQQAHEAAVEAVQQIRFSKVLAATRKS